MSNRIAIDVGGTFTDVVRLDPDGGLRFEKVPTTPAEPTHGVLAAFDRAEAPLDDTSMFTHGTTLGLNALLTRTGAPTAVVATKGFRDVYLLGRTAREGNYNIFYRKPAGLVERADTYEVDERMLFDGSVHRRFDEESARQVATEIRDRGYRAAAVAFLHSYANPDHEQAMKDVLLDVAPDLEVSLSSDLSREYREYERTSTAVLDAYIKPIIRTYLRVLQAHLDDGDFGGQFLMMRSGGGAMTAALAQDQPVNLILSGPGRRRRRRCRVRRDHRRAEPRHRRHGRDEPRRLAGHRRPARPPPGRPVRRAADQHLVAVHPHDRRRRWIDRLARRGRRPAGRSAERRGRPRAGVVRHRRRAADVHRCRPGDGLPRRGDPARRDAHAAARPGHGRARADRPGARHVDPRARPRRRAHLDDEDHRRRALDHRRARPRPEGLRPARLRRCRGHRRRRRRQGAGDDAR